MNVKLTYFKASGKYYSSGEYVSLNEHAFEVYGEVKEMLALGILPGLTESARFITLVEPENEAPALVFPVIR